MSTLTGQVPTRRRSERELIERFAPNAFSANLKLVEALNAWQTSVMRPTILARLTNKREKLSHEANVAFVGMVLAMQKDKIFPARPMDFASTYVRFWRLIPPDCGLVRVYLWEFCDPIKPISNYLLNLYSQVSNRVDDDIPCDARCAAFGKLPIDATTPRTGKPA